MTNGNEPINASPEWVSTENRDHGLTKREYFAAMAMASGSSPENAVKKADSLIAALNTKNETDGK